MAKLIAILTTLLLTSGCFFHYASIDAWEVSAGTCNLVLTPEPELLETVTLAAERWAAAVPCLVTIGDDGVPVYIVDKIPGRAIGKAQITWLDSRHEVWKVGFIQIERRDDGDYLEIIMHEVWHSLGHVEHIESGIGRANPDGEWPDQPSIDALCERLYCD